MYRLFVLFSLSLLFCAFKSDQGKRNDLLGTWSYSMFQTNSGLNVFKKTIGFDKDMPGLKFKKDGTIQVRQHSGWKDLEAPTYNIYSGTWSLSENQILDITYFYLSEKIQKKWQIVDLNFDNLTIKSIN